MKKNELVLYSNEDNKIIQTFCEKYDETIKNPQNSFQQYRIGVSKLCKTFLCKVFLCIIVLIKAFNANNCIRFIFVYICST